MNVLVYSGNGTTAESVKHCLESLRLHLSPYYSVIAVSESVILNDPWMHKTSALVIPGGADLPYCKTLDGLGNKKISQFVKKGGRFIGFCAGGYFGSARCEFEVGTAMEVSGPRELGFFPGTVKGCTFPPFEYESHKGAKCVQLNTEQGLVYNYYNGGGSFVDASSYSNTEVLATYCGVGQAESAAVVLCKVGQGSALLTGSHPEFTAALMKPSKNLESAYFEVHQTLKEQENDHNRKLFMRNCLMKLGLRVNEDVDMTVPHLTPIYVLSFKPETLFKLKIDLDTSQRLEDVNDTFVFHGDDENESEYFLKEDSPDTNDLDSIPKHLKLSTEVPSHKLTPYFNVAIYREHLKALSGGEEKIGEIGATFGYGEVVTSTNTLLEKNPSLLSKLPHGFTLTATTQVSGRGRSGNVWINPKGVMATSILFRIPVEQKVNIVTLQYLCGLAVVELILSYGSEYPGKGVGYEDLPIKLKWPNDIYSMKPEYITEERIDSVRSGNVTTSPATTLEQDEEIYSKISGSIINSQYLSNAFHLVLGVGINVSNVAPSICLNSVLDKLNELRAKKGKPALPHFQHEILLAKIVYTTEQFFKVFVNAGMKPFLPLYYKRWFHSGQTVVIDTKGNGVARKCVIKGITLEYGLLIVEDIDNGEVLELQPDGNSFDIFRGLIYKKS